MAIVVLVGWFSLSASAQDISEAIQKQYKSITSFQTEFSQELTNAASGESEARNGTIWYQKPKYIRWQTTHPEEELLVCKNDVVWDYFPEEKVAYKYSLEERFDSKTMLEFISGEVNLEQDFRIQKQEEDTENSDWTKANLIPKNPEPSLVKATIWVDRQENLIRQVLLVDFFGNTNQLTFEDIQLNVDMEEDMFAFEPPDGVEVMQGN